MNTLSLAEVENWTGTPLILFVGISTGGSTVHAVFDRWAALLHRPWTLRGLDLPPDAPAGTYGRLVAAIRDNPAVQGAVITAHKLRLHRACAAELAGLDRLAGVTREVNTLAATDTGVYGYARDALSLTRVVPSAPHFLCFGAGGSGTALMFALGGLRPVPAAVFADTDPRALADLHTVAVDAGLDLENVSFVPIGDPKDSDELVARLPAAATVVNATGLGKDAPGSPVTDRAGFRPDMLAWDFNYRGDLVFLDQAAARGARTLNGWNYFVAGWAGCLTAIAGTPFTDELFAEFRDAAEPYRM